MTQSETALIIAQYNEDVSWITNLDNRYIQKIYLYTKDINNTNFVDSKNIPSTRKYLPNIGREPHTYLYHIINNYDNLADINIFVQGSPRIKFELLNKEQDINQIINTNLGSYDEIYLDKYNKIFSWKGQVLDTIKEDFFEWYNLYINKTPIIAPHKIYFEANFIVSKKAILSRDIEYYKTLLNQLQSNNTEVGHFLERSWYYIFYYH